MKAHVARTNNVETNQKTDVEIEKFFASGYNYRFDVSPFRYLGSQDVSQGVTAQVLENHTPAGKPNVTFGPRVTHRNYDFNNTITGTFEVGAHAKVKALTDINPKNRSHEYLELSGDVGLTLPPKLYGSNVPEGETVPLGNLTVGANYNFRRDYEKDPYASISLVSGNNISNNGGLSP